MSGHTAEPRPYAGPAEATDISALLAQLDRYKRESEHLSRMNDLHHRLAGAADVTSVIESLSVWLMGFVDHRLLVFKDDSHASPCIVCSSHGPERRRDIEIAEAALARLQGPGDCGPRGLIPTGYFHRIWSFDFGAQRGRLACLRTGVPFSPAELDIADAAVKILSDPLHRAMQFENLYEQARRDNLTGLANRWVFRESVPPLLESARRHGTPLTLLSMDLDNFKLVNDTLGHAAGDMVLQEVAHILRSMVRSSDLLVRMGGDEFLAVLPATDLGSASVLAGRLRQAVRDTALRTAGCEKLGISIGLAQWSPELGLEEWLRKADDALYQSKGLGKY